MVPGVTCVDGLTTASRGFHSPIEYDVGIESTISHRLRYIIEMNDLCESMDMFKGTEFYGKPLFWQEIWGVRAKFPSSNSENLQKLVRFWWPLHQHTSNMSMIPYLPTNLCQAKFISTNGYGAFFCMIHTHTYTHTHSTRTHIFIYICIVDFIYLFVCLSIHFCIYWFTYSFNYNLCHMYCVYCMHSKYARYDISWYI